MLRPHPQSRSAAVVSLSVAAHSLATAAEKIAFSIALDRACGALPAQLVPHHRTPVRTAHTAHVSTNPRNVATISDMVRPDECVLAER